MRIINLREMCPVVTKGFKKELVFESPCVTLVFSTCHKSMVKKGKETNTTDSCTFELPRYETVNNDDNVLTLVVKNYSPNLDTNVSFINSNVIIELKSNNEKYEDREGRPCFSHSISEQFINVKKYDTIILN